MKFFAFIKKDLYETVPIGIFTSLLVSLMLYFVLSDYDILVNNFYNFTPRPDSYSISVEGNLHFYKKPITEDIMFFFMAFNIVLAIAISAQQFWTPWLIKTWPYHLQRALTRTNIFWAKFVAGILGFAAPLIVLWTGTFLYIRHHFPVPLGLDIWIEGLPPMCWGIVFYLATALSSLLSARLYTTRFFPLPIALLALLCSIGTLSFWSIVLFSTVISILLICQIIDEIQIREF
jgi:hypothetical protein